MTASVDFRLAISTIGVPKPRKEDLVVDDEDSDEYKYKKFRENKSHKSKDPKGLKHILSLELLNQNKAQKFKYLKVFKKYPEVAQVNNNYYIPNKVHKSKWPTAAYKSIQNYLK